MRKNIKPKYHYIIDCNTMTTLWGDFIRKFKDANIFISLNNFLEARDSYLQTIKTMKDMGDDEILESYLKETEGLKEALLFNQPLDNYIKSFIKTKDVFSKTFIINKGQNINVTIYRGFNIEHNGDIPTWIEEIIALSYWCKNNMPEVEVFTCNEDLHTFIKNSGLNLKYTYIDLSNLCL